MNSKERAALVREMRFELKQSRRDPRFGESRDAHMNRAGGGDAESVDAAARWDRARAGMPKPLRRRMQRWGGGTDAASVDGAYGYSGWQNHFNYSTPVARGSRRVRGKRTF